MRAVLALALAGALLSSCTLRPLYAGGGRGQVATTLRSIAVAPMPGRAGYLMRGALVERLGEGEANPRYRLEIELDDRITGFGIRLDDAVTRERRTLRARYRLVDARVGTVLLDARLGLTRASTWSDRNMRRWRRSRRRWNGSPRSWPSRSSRASPCSSRARPRRRSREGQSGAARQGDQEPGRDSPLPAARTG
jgi:LPS-assembly lipoprotein